MSSATYRRVVVCECGHRITMHDRSELDCFECAALSPIERCTRFEFLREELEPIETEAERINRGFSAWWESMFADEMHLEGSTFAPGGAAYQAARSNYCAGWRDAKADER